MFPSGFARHAQSCAWPAWVMFGVNSVACILSMQPVDEYQSWFCENRDSSG
ncbi:hypothetical protein PAMC26577_05570 [Caballeronia sordidicola]|uniref:Uncharacterized protein n=1 Tax=Caballeronia sordidicola TaxID=196367 RepID=A0A242N348_CABSO|nr:hypothetical protein PAMC26577_05570 [Caballeronia sordidicola]